MKRMTPTARMFTRCLGPASLAMLAFTACSSEETSPSSTFPLPPRIAITSVKGDPKSQLLAAIYARVLEDGGFRVARKDPVELDRAGYYQAMQDGEFQLIPEFTGDLLSFVYSQPESSPLPSTSVPDAPATTQAPITIPTTTTLPPETTVGETTVDSTLPPGTTVDSVVGQTTTSTDPASGFVTGAVTTTTGTPDTTVATTDTTTVATTDTTTPGTTTADAATTTTEAPAPSNGHSVIEQVLAINAGLPSLLVVNNGSQAEDKVVVACTTAAMEANAAFELFTLTNLASLAPGIVLGGSTEYMADEVLGYPAMVRYYGGEFKDTATVDDAELADAVANDTADCFATDSLNPLITTERMTILVDDQLMAPSNAAIALMASTIATPEAIGVLDALAASLTTERLNQMLNEIVANGTDPVVVANAFVDTL